MSREIRFRGKRVKGGGWMYGDLCHGEYTDTLISYYKAKTDGTKVFYIDVVDPATVGQFTGLKDKNGKDIYEGDNVRHNGHVGTVEYRADAATFAVDWHDGSTNLFVDFFIAKQIGDIEIIGNIHDNDLEANK